MPVCELRHATTEDTDSVYALICELLKNELDYQAFRDGFAANLLDPNVHYRLALRNGEVVGMISLHMQFHLHHANWIGEIQELVVLPPMRGQKNWQSASGLGRRRSTSGWRRANGAFHKY